MMPISSLLFSLLVSFSGASFQLSAPADADAGHVAVIHPVCETPSHDRLVERVGRDVCGPALDENGRARSVGLMPTRCPEPNKVLKVDLHGSEDVCLPTAEKVTSEGDNK